MITREVNNVGSPIKTPDGTILANHLLRFKLVNLIDQETEVFDSTSGELILTEVRVFTDDFGIFTVNLWPNDRGEFTTKYQCIIDSLFKFHGTVKSGNTALSFLYFKIGEPA